MARCMAHLGLEKLDAVSNNSGGETSANDVISAPSMAINQGADVELSCFVFVFLLFVLLNKFYRC